MSSPLLARARKFHDACRAAHAAVLTGDLYSSAARVRILVEEDEWAKILELSGEVLVLVANRPGQIPTTYHAAAAPCRRVLRVGGDIANYATFREEDIGTLDLHRCTACNWREAALRQNLSC